MAPSWEPAIAELVPDQDGPDGNPTPIYQFPTTERLPVFTALYGGNGNYYGVSIVPQDGSGFVYSVTPAGTLTNMELPTGSLASNDNWVPIPQADGNLYGATTAGEQTTPAHFIILRLTANIRCCTHSRKATTANLYGTTHGARCCTPEVLFQVSKSGGAYSALYIPATA